MHLPSFFGGPRPKLELKKHSYILRGTIAVPGSDAMEFMSSLQNGFDSHKPSLFGM